MSTGNNYILVSPVKDEETNIEKTIRSVLQQTIRPSRWVIVDDGSLDRTHSIVEEYAHLFSWITLVTHTRDVVSRPESGIPQSANANNDLIRDMTYDIQAFLVGYEVIRDVDYDFIVKLDCDTQFPPNYFEQLLTKFHEDEQLGIASGIYLEETKGKWRTVRMPAYHAAGQTKMVRAKCFADIGGFVAYRGWDTVDEIKAQNRGWKTRHFKDLEFYHLKKEGSGMGFMRTNMMHGEIYYLTGGNHRFFVLKFLHRLLQGKPFFMGGIAMLWGYLKQYAMKRPRLVSDSEAKVYQHMLNERIANRLSSMGFR